MDSTIGLRLVIACCGFLVFEIRIKIPRRSWENVCCSVNARLNMFAIGFASISVRHLSSSSGNLPLPLARLLLRRFVEHSTSVKVI